ncbi:hypothetical protein CWATWH0402_51 [Crocosphaera watsonii WH 0402]|uniref:Uncharacterized protein n=1 Tax=Crocosphaera watsonii WH 0402 TaxID=1284629 RepID=T2JNE8_CROWT|nr:hypothetical protein CWATWH0402_51 [Crocosphaera watsonii WH 0402]
MHFQKLKSRYFDIILQPSYKNCYILVQKNKAYAVGNNFKHSIIVHKFLICPPYDLVRKIK